MRSQGSYRAAQDYSTANAAQSMHLYMWCETGSTCHGLPSNVAASDSAVQAVSIRQALHPHHLPYNPTHHPMHLLHLCTRNALLHVIKVLQSSHLHTRCPTLTCNSAAQLPAFTSAVAALQQCLIVYKQIGCISHVPCSSKCEIVVSMISTTHP